MDFSGAGNCGLTPRKAAAGAGPLTASVSGKRRQGIPSATGSRCAHALPPQSGVLAFFSLFAGGFQWTGSNVYQAPCKRCQVIFFRTVGAQRLPVLKKMARHPANHYR